MAVEVSYASQQLAESFPGYLLSRYSHPGLGVKLKEPTEAGCKSCTVGAYLGFETILFR
eukprot:jgi/Pico_ML_1/55716/g1366.t1